MYSLTQDQSGIPIIRQSQRWTTTNERKATLSVPRGRVSVKTLFAFEGDFCERVISSGLAAVYQPSVAHRVVSFVARNKTEKGKKGILLYR
eukprot:scaffold33044_cov43-Attheya_sp.AAC.1